MGREGRGGKGGEDRGGEGREVGEGTGREGKGGDLNILLHPSSSFLEICLHNKLTAKSGRGQGHVTLF